MTSARRNAWLLVAGIVAAGLLGVTYLIVLMWPQFVYAQDRKAAQELVDQLRDRRPANVAAPVWEVAEHWAGIAYANVCFSAEHVPLDELRRFRADVERRLSGPVDLATIDWLWQRLAATGPHGQHYRNRFEPVYREHLRAELDKLLPFSPARPTAGARTGS
jgi:hypothetical protein